MELFILTLRGKSGIIWNERLVHPAKAFFVAAKTVSAVIDVAKRGKVIGNSLSEFGQQNISFAWVFEWWDRLVIEADKALDYWLPIQKKPKSVSRRVEQNGSQGAGKQAEMQRKGKPNNETRRGSYPRSSSASLKLIQVSPMPPSSRSSKRTSTSTDSLEIDDAIFEMEIEPPSNEESDVSDSEDSESLDNPKVSAKEPAGTLVLDVEYRSPPFRHSLISVSVELTRRLSVRLKQNVIIRTFAVLLEPSERFFSIIIDTFYVHIKVFSSPDSFLSTVRNKVTFQFNCKWDDRLNNPLLSFYSEEKVYMRGA